MSETDLKKRDLLKTLPVAPALLLGGAAGLTATQAQGIAVGTVVVFVVKSVRVWKLVSIGCEVVERINENLFDRIDDLNKYLKKAFGIDDNHMAFEMLEEIGGTGEAMVAEVTNPEGETMHIAITESNLTVFFV